MRTCLKILTFLFLSALSAGGQSLDPARNPPAAFSPIEEMRSRLWPGGVPAVEGREVRHHGAVSNSRGAGSPIETNFPLTLPEGYLLGFLRSEYVPFRRFSSANPFNKASFTFLNAGLAYGISPSITGSLIFPYAMKSQDTLGQTSGIGDVKVGLNFGFNYLYGKGLQWNKSEDTAVSLEGNNKTYLSGFFLLGFPTGDWKQQPFSPDMHPGFGSVSYSLGLSAARNLSNTTTLSADTSVDVFTTRSDGFRFGTELRSNVALVTEVFGTRDARATLRKIDAILEFNFLKLGRDRVGGIPETASGGSVIYISPGARFQVGKTSIGVLLKIPAIKGLNEGADQQGSEGLEHFRLIMTASRTF